MKYKEKIRAEVEKCISNYKDMLGKLDKTQDGWVDSASMLGAKIDVLTHINYFIDSLTEEPVSDDLEEEQMNKKYLWKDAQGDDLPAIDIDVIALQGRKVVFAHRPNPDGWDGINITTGKVTHYTPITYDKGGWNTPDVKYWLDAPLPDVENMEE